MTEDPVTRPGTAAGPRADLLAASFAAADLATVRHQIRQHCADASLTGDDLDGFVLACTSRSPTPYATAAAAGACTYSYATTRSSAKYATTVEAPACRAHTCPQVTSRADADYGWPRTSPQASWLAPGD